MTPVDLDGIATARPEPAVVEAMLPWLSGRHANPESLHSRGAAARLAIEQAREEVAALVGARPEEIVFTSGVTEANNLGLKGAAALARRYGRPSIAVPAHEHPSLLHPARTLARDGCDLEILPVGRDGLVAASSLPSRAPDLVAFAHAHAELGSLQPAAALCARVRERGGRLLLDAALTAGRIPLDLEHLGGPDLLSLSFHHMGGPMGVGALVGREGLPISPLIEGGVQERGYRPGSPHLAGIVGAGAAARHARLELGERTSRLDRLGRLLAGALLLVEGVARTGPPPDERLPGHISVTVSGVDGEALVLALEERGVLAATGSPCASEAGLPSASLRAAGYTALEARGASVFCLPPTMIPGEVDLQSVVTVFHDEVRRLRSLSGRAGGGVP